MVGAADERTAIVGVGGMAEDRGDIEDATAVNVGL
jgi:hypothetical protein